MSQKHTSALSQLVTEPGALRGQFWEQKSSVGGGGDCTQVQKEEGNATESDNPRVVSKSDLFLLLWFQGNFGVKHKNKRCSSLRAFCLV